MTRFDIADTALESLRLIRRRPIGDSRGFLERLYCDDEIGGLVPGRRIMQINRTLTTAKGIVRGMHFQRPPHAETKIVNCLRGRVFDVAVDLRRNSPTFLQWHAEVLSGDNHRALLIPEGFAHGFQALTDDCEMLYFHTAKYAPAVEAGLNPRDPLLGIFWPEPITEMSVRDAAHPFINDSFGGLDL